MTALKNVSLLLYLLLTTLFTAAQQNGTVRGILSDSATHTALKAINISLCHVNDNTVQSSFLSGNNGAFSSGPISYGHYYLRISYLGYETVKIPLSLTTQQLDLDTIYLSTKEMLLDTVVIQEQAIMQNKDTLEYNASRFKTRAYDNLSELLKLLPGLQINSDGTISINGQVINQLMVDGKPFFDGTPAMALTHLPADIVKKIQVFASNNVTNNGIPVPPGFPGSKTLNVVLKANKRKGDFGKIMAGEGSGGTYTGSGDLNHMNGGQQISLIGDGGNVEQSNNADGVGIAANGIHRNINSGLNYRDSRNENASINGSIFANDLHNKTLQRAHTLNIFPGDSTTILDQNAQGETHSNMQRGNLNLDYKPDAFNTFTIQPKITLQHNNGNYIQQSTQHYQASGDTIYHSNGTTTSDRNGTIASSLLQYTHSWHQPLKKLTLGMNLSGNNDGQHTSSYTATQSTTGNTHLDQRNISKNNGLNIAPYLNYTTPLNDKTLLTILGNYSYNRSTMSYKTFRLNDSSQHLYEPDSTQSNDFNSTYHTGAAQFSIRRQWKKAALTIGSGVEADWLSGQNLSHHTLTERHFINTLPVAMFSLNMKGSNTLMLGYNGKPMAVSVQQLQPVSVTADSLFIAEGNPDLRQPYVHSMSLGYTAIMESNSAFFSATFTGSITQHAIQPSTTLLENGAQVSKPVNLDGSKDLSLVINYNIPALQHKSGFNFAANATYSKSPVLSNGKRMDSRLLFYTGTIAWNYRQPNGFNLNISAAPGYNSLQTAPGTTQGFFTAAILAKSSYIKGDWEASLSARYIYNGSLPASYQPKYPLAIPAVSFRCLKHKEGAIGLSVMDLFNQQSGASRSITASTVADTWSQTRGRYILATFTYNFRKFGK